MSEPDAIADGETPPLSEEEVDLMAPHGPGVYGCAIFAGPGEPTPECLEQSHADLIRRFREAGGTRPLCYVWHYETARIEDFPEDARPTISEFLTKFFENGRTERLSLIRTWQHFEPCEERLAADRAL